METHLSGVQGLRVPGNLRSGRFLVAEVLISYDQGPWNFGVSILEFRGDKVARESVYVCQGWEPPEWRAPWRAAP
jgi:hypothetical protein